jgi:hypothetical protein
MALWRRSKPAALLPHSDGPIHTSSSRSYWPRNGDLQHEPVGTNVGRQGGDHRAKIHSINPLERLNGKIKRRTDVISIFPNEDAITGLVGATNGRSSAASTLVAGPANWHYRSRSC